MRRCWPCSWASCGRVGHLRDPLFRSILVGLGIDFGLCRRLATKMNGTAARIPPQPSGPPATWAGHLQRCDRHSGAFFVLGFSSFRGIKEFGWIADLLPRGGASFPFSLSGSTGGAYEDEGGRNRLTAREDPGLAGSPSRMGRPIPCCMAVPPFSRRLQPPPPPRPKRGGGS